MLSGAGTEPSAPKYSIRLSSGRDIYLICWFRFGWVVGSWIRCSGEEVVGFELERSSTNAVDNLYGYNKTGPRPNTSLRIGQNPSKAHVLARHLQHFHSLPFIVLAGAATEPSYFAPHGQVGYWQLLQVSDTCLDALCVNSFAHLCCRQLGHFLPQYRGFGLDGVSWVQPRLIYQLRGGGAEKLGLTQAI
jgi:hypothetical protein